jgi:hypothetical protein
MTKAAASTNRESNQWHGRECSVHFPVEQRRGATEGHATTPTNTRTRVGHLKQTVRTSWIPSAVSRVGSDEIKIDYASVYPSPFLVELIKRAVISGRLCFPDLLISGGPPRAAQLAHPPSRFNTSPSLSLPITPPNPPVIKKRLIGSIHPSNYRSKMPPKKSTTAAPKKASGSGPAHASYQGQFSRLFPSHRAVACSVR